jgi:HD-GYP domain-containing protein (c-di-GMP phosphodiesterase class II)
VSGDEEVGSVRLAELLGALSLGIDLGFGQPMEHVLRQCRIATRVGDLIDLDDRDRSAVYYAALLVNVGCHTDAHEQARWFGDDIALRSTKYDHEPYSAGDIASMLRLLGSGGTPLHRLRVAFDFAVSGRKEVDGMLAGHARLARRLGTELGLPDAALDAVGASYEMWNGKGVPGERAGSDIPLASRVVQLADFLEVAHRSGGIRAAVELARRRAGKQFDPHLAEIVCGDAEKVFAELDDSESWDAVLDGEPAMSRALSPDELDDALAAVSRFVDLKSPYTLGHSSAVADLASSAALAAGGTDDEAATLRRAAHVARFGQLGVSNAIWDKVRPLTASDWERIRLYPYLTGRMLERSPALAPLGRIAVQVREHLDGSGYPRGLSGSSISWVGRLLAVADAYQAMLEPRPHRAARDPDAAAAELRRDVDRGWLDGRAVDAVLGVAGHRVARRRSGPGGLTDREVEVLQLIARGASTKEVAAVLVISPKTAGTHIEHIYAKLGVANRAEAGLFAVEHGLLPEDRRQVSPGSAPSRRAGR